MGLARLTQKGFLTCNLLLAPPRFPHRLASRTASLLGLGALSLLGLAAARPATAQGFAYTTITNDDLGTPGVDVTGFQNSPAAGITNAGVVVGTVVVDPGNGTYMPSDGYEYDTVSGAATLISYQASQGGPTLQAVSGDGSQVLGFYNPGGTGPNNYFTDSGGHISALPEPYGEPANGDDNGFAGYNGINSTGETVGTYIDDGYNTEHGFLRGSDGTFTSISDPNSPIDFTQAFGINSSGTIVGGYTHTINFVGNNEYFLDTGFIRSADGTLTDFSVPGEASTDILGISDNGNLFGAYSDATQSNSGYFTDIGGVIDTSINVPGSTFTEITGINDAGQISGFYGDANNNEFGFYGNFNPVPEASSVVSFGLLLLGGAVVIARKKKAAAAC